MTCSASLELYLKKLQQLKTSSPTTPSPYAPVSQVIEGFDHRSTRKYSTLEVNENTSRAGAHQDPPAPLPAMIAGPGVHKLINGEWRQTCRGGRLYIDGLVDLTYGPIDVVILDGNFLHGITNLRDLPDAKMSSRPELVRFSLIRFADWQREKMKKYANYQGGWREEWIADVPWKEGYEPPAPEDVGEPSMRGARAASRHM